MTPVSNHSHNEDQAATTFPYSDTTRRNLQTWIMTRHSDGGENSMSLGH
jgi:hypothetical protein